MVNYACAFSQSESGKYFELIITVYIYKRSETSPDTRTSSQIFD